MSSTSPPPTMMSQRPSPPVHSHSTPPTASSSSSSHSLHSYSSSSTQSLPPWHFPFGPSSKFNSKSQTRPRHGRYKSAYTPRGPVLSTEKRAHRRAAHSSVSIPRYSPASPSGSRSPLSRFSSYANSIPSATKMSNPSTPAKHFYRRSSSIQDSPFSDYFSEDGRSAYMTCASDETKQLLVRMNRLQSHLMRDQSESGKEAIAIVGRKLGEIEGELHRLSISNIDDSAVFMEDEEKSVAVVAAPVAPVEVAAPIVDSTPPTPSRKSSGANRTHRSMPSINDSVMESSEKFAYEQIKAERDTLAVRLQGLSEGLSTVQNELRQRYAEVRELNNFHNEERERFEEQVEKLRSENEQLRSDLGFEYSEMLFLKLQMKSLEVDIDNIADDEPEGADVTVEDVRKARAKRVKKNRILSEMDRWRTDWQDVNARFKRRRSRYAVPTSPMVAAGSEEDGAEWHLQMVRGSNGCTTSLTIKRIEGGAVGGLAVQTEEVDHLAPVHVAIPVKAPVSYVDHVTQTDLTAEDFNFDDLELADPDSYCANPAHAEYGISAASPAMEEDEESDEEAGLSEDEFEAFEDEEEDDEEEEGGEEEEEEEEEYLLEAGIEKSHHHEKEPTGAAPSLHTHHFPSPQPPSTSRSAWQELWSSLASLSGLPDDDEDDF